MKMQAVASSAVLAFAAALSLSAGPKQTMLMNRLGPSQMTLYIANADGSGERPLFSSSGFDYNASFSPDGKWIVFTSERNGYGQADLYRVRVDGSGLERLTDDPALDDQAAFSPDGNQVARPCRRGRASWTASSGPLGRPTANGSRSRRTAISISSRTIFPSRDGNIRRS